MTNTLRSVRESLSQTLNCALRKTRIEQT